MMSLGLSRDSPLIWARMACLNTLILGPFFCEICLLISLATRPTDHNHADEKQRFSFHIRQGVPRW